MCQKHAKKQIYYLWKFSLKTSITKVESNMLRVSDQRTDGPVYGPTDGHSEL